MIRIARLAAVAAVIATVPSIAAADLVAYDDEAAFLADLAALGHTPVSEGFEDDTAWGSVRTSIVDGEHTAVSITHLGVQWTANNAGSGVTTGSGPARSGSYGFFTLPHGDPGNNINDGWIGTATGPKLVAVGGWVETNTPPADLGLSVDGVDVDFPEDANILGTAHTFFGAIDPAGFTTFYYHEREGTPGELKYIFSDDYTFAFVPEPATLLLLFLGGAGAAWPLRRGVGKSRRRA